MTRTNTRLTWVLEKADNEWGYVLHSKGLDLRFDPSAYTPEARTFLMFHGLKQQEGDAYNSGSGKTLQQKIDCMKRVDQKMQDPKCQISITDRSFGLKDPNGKNALSPLAKAERGLQKAEKALAETKEQVETMEAGLKASKMPTKKIETLVADVFGTTLESQQQAVKDFQDRVQKLTK